jgi:phosphatidylglycerol---prolipoprotein diacylglyceryl transferase
MHPALTLFGLDVPAYELLLALGACALVGVVAGSAPRDIPRERVFAWISGTYLAAIAGARAAFAVSRLPEWHEALTALASTGAVGFSSIGGLVAGALAAWWLARALALPFERLAGPLLLGGCLFGVLARVGCFLAGCCHGHPTTLPWGVVYPPLAPAVRLYGPEVALHPSPLYEAALLLVIAAWLAWPRSPGRASRAVAAGVAYLSARFALDFLRGDASRFEGLTPVQWLALGVLVVGTAAAAGQAFFRTARKTSPAGGVSLK